MYQGIHLNRIIATIVVCVPAVIKAHEKANSKMDNKACLLKGRLQWQITCAFY